MRTGILTFLFLATATYTAVAMRPELVPLREPLGGMPQQLDRWTGRNTEIKPEILAVLGADDYVSRFYEAPGAPLSLFIGYYESQRQGDTIHSPMNCLPGAGWQPVKIERLPIMVPGRDQPVVVNRILIEKGMERQVVLYWYQSHGRVVASEYSSKVFMVYDAVRTNRSDAAMVRIVSPITLVQNGESDAEQRAVAFTKALFPLLDSYLPS